MTYDARNSRVTIVSDKAQGPTAGTHSFDALEFLARILAHVPRKSEILVRYYGAYSVRRRAAARKRPAPTPSPPEEPLAPTPERIRDRKRRWAELLRRIWNVEIDTCPRCGAEMSVSAFTLDPKIIAAMLKRIRDKGRDPRAGPWAARAPPAHTA